MMEQGGVETAPAVLLEAERPEEVLLDRELIWIQALRTIQPNEEIFIDYGSDADTLLAMKHYTSPFLC